MKTFTDSTIHLYLAFALAVAQISIAIFAVHASDQDRLSDGACIGGHFGSLANLFILIVVLIWVVTLAVKSRKMTTRHEGLKPLGVVALSSTIALFIGLNAALGCTV